MNRVMPPGGWAADREEPRPRSLQVIEESGRSVAIRWLDPPFRPEPPDCNQAYAICFTDAGEIVLVLMSEADAPYWNLVGGGVEGDETLEEALLREVAEEACAEVIKCAYIGCQRIDDPNHPDGPRRYYQARFWARVNLEDWDPQFETVERRLVRPSEFRALLAWGGAPTAEWILREGLRIDGSTVSQLPEAPPWPVLSDGVVTLRPMTVADAQAHLAGEDDEQMRWLSGGRSTTASVTGWIERNRVSWEAGGPTHNFGISTTANGLVGMIEANSDASQISGLGAGEANISYGLYPVGRGLGYATRAVNLVSTYLVDCGLRPVIRASPANARSISVAQRCGFLPGDPVSGEDGEPTIILRRDTSGRLVQPS